MGSPEGDEVGEPVTRQNESSKSYRLLLCQATADNAVLSLVRTALAVVLVAAYWGAMGVFLGVAYIIGAVTCDELCYSERDEGWQYNADAWQWDALQVLAVLAFFAALLVFARRSRRWRLLLYRIHLGLVALLAPLLWIGYYASGNFDPERPPMIALAIAGELAAVLAITTSRSRPSTQASDRL